jgi:queuine tRNA-ribosyltransferase
MRFQVFQTDGAARRGRLSFARGTVETPAFMPVGTYGTVKTMTPEELRASGAEIILGNTFHLMLRPGTAIIEAARRSARLHALGRADSHRFRRLSGIQLGGDPQDHRGRREIPVAGGRRHGVSGAGGIDGGPARAGFGHRHDLRRMHPLPATETEARQSMELSLRWARRSKAAHGDKPRRAVRHRPGRDVSAPAPHLCGRAARTRLRRLRHRRSGGRRTPGGTPARARLHRTVCCRRPRRAT